jgi:hypothetical protein
LIFTHSFHPNTRMWKKWCACHWWCQQRAWPNVCDNAQSLVYLLRNKKEFFESLEISSWRVSCRKDHQMGLNGMMCLQKMRTLWTLLWWVLSRNLELERKTNIQKVCATLITNVKAIPMIIPALVVCFSGNARLNDSGRIIVYARFSVNKALVLNILTTKNLNLGSGSDQWLCMPTRSLMPKQEQCLFAVC